MPSGETLPGNDAVFSHNFFPGLSWHSTPVLRYICFEWGKGPLSEWL